MSLHLQSFPTQNPNYELTVLDDELILFSVSHEKAIYLNHTAQIIWKLCDGDTPVFELIKILRERYVDEKNIDQQVITALHQMLDDAVIGISDEPIIQ